VRLHFAPRQLRPPVRSIAALGLLACVALSTAACIRPRQSPNLPRIFAPARESTGKTPIIIIPGILGSQIVNGTSGEVLWPSTDKSKTDDLDLPIGPDFEANADDLRASGILDVTRLSLLLPEVRVYIDLLETLEKAAGYRRASIDEPPPSGAVDTFYVFYYDWRRDNAENARLLARKVEALKAKLERPDLKFNILAHSMGGLIARYYAMYGGRPLVEGDTAGPDWAGAANISRLLLLGAPNHGSMDALRSLIEGYNFYGGEAKRSRLFNKLEAHLIASLPSAYQLLPHAGTAVYVNEAIELEPLDLFDANTWKQNEWGIYSKSHGKRREKRYGATAAARARAEEIFLAAALARAELFHRSLARPSSTPRPFRLYVFGGDCEPTLRAPFIGRAGGKRRTIFRPESAILRGKLVEKKELRELMFAPGDGRVTRTSLLAAWTERAAQELSRPAFEYDYSVFACELHGDLPNNSSMQDNVLSILVTDLDRAQEPVGAGT
jgi:pimeloyl-ACP methyl ester carboxylesterase